MRKSEIHRNLLAQLLLSFLALLSLSLYAQKDVVGKYVGNESNKTLMLNENGSYFLLNEARGVMFYHIDTLSFGKWKRDDDFIIINSSKSIESCRMKVVVEESFKPNLDSLVLEILNPYEDFSHKNENGHRIFEYVFNIDSYEGRFGPEIIMKTNRISLYKISTDKIVNMAITIVPNSYLYPSKLAFNYLVTDTYIFKNRNSNHIKVIIPDLTIEYIGYERFKEEYLRIRKSDLILRGEMFEKQVNH